MVKIRDKIPQNNKENSKSSPKRPKSKLKSRYNYMSSTMKKPKIKAVKHQEVYLDKKKAIKRTKIPQNNEIKKTISTRKASSNQKNQILSNKFSI